MEYKDRLYVALFGAFATLVKKTPLSIQEAIAKGLGSLAYAVDSKHKKVAMTNIQATLKLPKKEAKRLTKQVYRNLAFLLKDFVLNQNTTKEAVLAKVDFKGEEILHKALQSGKPILFMGSHYGNWELIPLALAARYDLPISVVGKPLPSKAMDEILRANREQFDIQLIEKRRAMRKIFQAISKGRAIGILVDQHTTDREGIEVDFLGLPAMHTPVLSLLSRRYEAPIIPIFITTEDHRHYTIHFQEPIQPLRTKDEKSDIHRLTQAQADVLARQIHKRPQEWFWLHKRWKKALRYD